VRWGVLAAALALDYAVGDPDVAIHPVRLLGRFISWTEKRARRGQTENLRLRGIGVVLLVLGAAYLAVEAWLAMAAWADRALGWNAWEPLEFCAESTVVWACIGVRSMLDHARAVLRELGAGALGAARTAVSRIVGRDVDALDGSGVRRACLESVAESLGDGVLGPLFFAVLAGPAGAALYRAANTLDSMLGHKDPEWIEIGWASARLDDVLSWIPARLAALCAAAGAFFLGLDAAAALATARRDAPRQPSPNSGWPEAAFAGALGVRLGGPVSYRGRRVDKAQLGSGSRLLDEQACEAALRLFSVSAWVAVAAGEAFVALGHL